MIEKIFTLIIGVAVGVLVVMYHRWLVKIVGTNSWAERTFGGGGTYTMYQLLGVFIVIITVLYVTGGLEKVFGAILGLVGF